jgi:hypothetical protein
MKIRPYRIGDLDHIVQRPRDDFGDDQFENIKAICEKNVTFTFEHDGIPVAVCGCEIIQRGKTFYPSSGSAQCWSIVSDDARGKGLDLTKAIRGMINDFAKSNNIGRMQAIIKPQVHENIRWIELLGFRFESTMVKAGPEGIDLAMYVRIYE